VEILVGGPRKDVPDVRKVTPHWYAMETSLFDISEKYIHISTLNLVILSCTL